MRSKKGGERAGFAGALLFLNNLHFNLKLGILKGRFYVKEIKNGKYKILYDR